VLALDDKGQLCEITHWEQILFPFDPHLGKTPDLAAVPVHPMIPTNGMLAREVYTCDANGSIRVAISSQPAGNIREYVIGQLSSN
jgi:hypothetical protein